MSLADTDRSAAARPPTPDGTRPPDDRHRPFAPLALVLSLALCFAAAGLGGAVTSPQIDGWYRTIEKPAFNPPDWIFGPVWTVLFIMMALVLWQIWRTPAPAAATARLRRRALAAFVVQLVVNVAWSAAFFGLQSPTAGLVVIVALLASIVWLIRAARPVVGPMTWLLAPYLAWVSFAAVLNLTIVVLNR